MNTENGVSPEMREKIRERLRVIEQDYNVTVLWAVESGSRAYGLHSEDSDYDVRFLFVQPLERYLAIDDKAKERVIEVKTDDLDMSGWDIFKAVRQLRKYNPQLMEWLHSPIVYIDNMDMHILTGMREMGTRHADAPAVFYHYVHMARGNFNQYIESPITRAVDEGREPQVLIKKYLYVVRPILALRYVENVGFFPPLRFMEMWTPSSTFGVPKTVMQQMLDIAYAKQQGREFGLGAPLPELNAWIRGELTRFGEMARGYAREHPQIEGTDGQWLEWALTMVLTRQAPKQLLELQERLPGALRLLAPAASEE